MRRATRLRAAKMQIQSNSHRKFLPARAKKGRF
jgi:hypothetical protein